MNAWGRGAELCRPKPVLTSQPQPLLRPTALRAARPHPSRSPAGRGSLQEDAVEGGFAFGRRTSSSIEQQRRTHAPPPAGPGPGSASASSINAMAGRGSGNYGRGHSSGSNALPPRPPSTDGGGGAANSGRSSFAVDSLPQGRVPRARGSVESQQGGSSAAQTPTGAGSAARLAESRGNSGNARMSFMKAADAMGVAGAGEKGPQGMGEAAGGALARKGPGYVGEMLGPLTCASGQRRGKGRMHASQATAGTAVGCRERGAGGRQCKSATR